MAPIPANLIQRSKLESLKGLILQPAEEMPPQSASKKQGALVLDLHPVCLSSEGPLPCGP